jgi:hypothetical protein
MQSLPRELATSVSSPAPRPGISEAPSALPVHADADRAVRSQLAPTVATLLGALDPAEVDTILLSIADLTRTLRLVRDAHECGVIALPLGLAERVTTAVRHVPSFLGVAAREAR